jgi:molecular chaperone GrpE
MTKKKDNKPAEQPAAEKAAPAAVPPAQPDYYDQLLRLQADFENYRKRTEREAPLLIQFGRAEAIKKLLPLYDTLLKAEAEVNKQDADAAHIKQGLNMIFEEFNKVFKSEGVEVLCCKGKPYDPMTQEVITTIPCAAGEDGTVAEELRRAITLDGKLLRPAQVIVGKKKEEETNQNK